MIDLFGEWYDFLERPENDGQPLHITPEDPGGATAWGWTYQTWRVLAPRHGIVDVSLDAFRQQTRETLRPMTYVFFWAAYNCQFMPPGFGLFWADFQFGSGRATRVLQEVLGVTPDGVVGHLETLPALARITDPAERVKMLDRFYQARVAYYDTLPDHDHWPGWYRRAEQCVVLAKQLAVVPRTQENAL